MASIERLHMLRKQHRMTLQDVADYIGLSRATVYKYETGQVKDIPADKLEKLSILFGVTKSYLMGWDKEEPPDDEPVNDDIRLLVRDINKLSPEQVKQAKSVFRAMFQITNPELFKEDSDNDA